MPIKLCKDNIPKEFWQLIPLAQIYGVSDDCYRSELIETISAQDKLKLKEFLERFNGKLDEWLAGPESNGPEFTEEYIAFSALRMAADEA